LFGTGTENDSRPVPPEAHTLAQAGTSMLFVFTPIHFRCGELIEESSDRLSELRGDCRWE